ncbi:hypothetical protein C804_06021 [Lachnospiraceae bacterium A4]|nr:hypothetical protein C804_06021 [Lachnospiraceae bacterium A4]
MITYNSPVTILLVFIVLKLPNDIQLEVDFYSFPANAERIKVYIDSGSGYSEKEMFYSDLNNHIVITVPESFKGRIKRFRLDLIDTSGTVRIEKIMLKKNGIPVSNLTNAFPNLLQKMVDIEIDNERMIIVKCLSADGQIEFTDAFISEFNNLFNFQPIEFFLVTTFSLILVLGVLVYYRRPHHIVERIKNVYTYIFNLLYKKKMFFYIAFFMLGVLFCYKLYLKGVKYFIFDGIACDSLWQTYPGLVKLAKNVENGKGIIGWDFEIGFGSAQNVSAINIFNWVVLFGHEALPYLMGISQIIKIFLAYLLFFYYMKILGRRDVVAHISAMCYSLNGAMVTRQYWSSYPNEIVLTALVLLCIELSISRNNHKWIPIGIFFYSISMGEYNTILIAALTIGYTLFRTTQVKNKIKEVIELMYITLASYVLALVTGAAYILMPIIKALTSQRMKVGVSSSKDFLTWIPDLKMLMAAFLKTLSNDIAGNSSKIYGLGNVLTAPAFYCGIIMVIVLPIALYKIKGKERVICIVSLLMCTCYVSFKSVRYIANGFAGYDTFKLSSIWIVIILIYYGSLGMEYLFLRNKYTDRIVIISSIVLLGMVFIVSMNIKSLDIKIIVRIIITIILTTIALELVFYVDKFNLSFVLVFIVMLDLYCNLYFFSATDLAAYADEIGCYNDGTEDMVNKLDKDELYRIDKKYDTVFYCDSLIQGYNGVKSYQGGTSMNDNLMRFLKLTDMPNFNESTKHYVSGINNSTYIDALLGVKYILTKQKLDNDFGTKYIEEYNGIRLYEVTNALPIGYCYDSIITDKEFQQLNTLQRRSVLTDACVIEQNDFNIHHVGLDNYTKELESDVLCYEYDENLKKITFNSLNSNNVIVVQFDTVSKGEDYYILKYGNENGELGYIHFGVEAGIKQQFFEFCGADISYIQIAPIFLSRSINNITHIDNISVKEYNKEFYYGEIQAGLEERNKASMKDVIYSDNKINGIINTERDSILYFSIPFDSGWNIYVDGVKSELINVNYGFIGTYISAGNHEIELQYTIPHFKIAVIISSFGMSGIVIWCVYWKKKERKYTSTF